ncbi:hypothetical protein [Neobacillus terrae]|uniref:hypothetical protein n=1 Tax=Neobacillus terrae TaxID=3034837 RepID=UPI00140B4A6F|nr:hypothetical protein [Neobacillus terrae]NHM33790.1 hypothetical protein [Neobacillus terrae]
MYEIPKKDEWLTYRDAFMDLLNKGATLVANQGNLNINRKLDERIPENAQLLVICDKKTIALLNNEVSYK